MGRPIAPSLDDIRAIAKDLISFADPDLIAIARTNEHLIDQLVLNCLPDTTSTYTFKWTH